MTEAHWNVADLKWVPVVTLRGDHELWTLGDALGKGSQVTDLDLSSPIERMAVTRLLVAFLALVAREAGLTKRFNDPSEIDDAALAEAAIAVLQRHRDLLFLEHPTTPFLQEWEPTPEQAAQGVRITRSKPRSVESLRPETPGDSEKRWWTRDASRVAATRPGDAIMLAATYWFGSFGSNGPPLNSDLGTSTICYLR
jgi:hypothetical protein